MRMKFSRQSDNVHAVIYAVPTTSLSPSLLPNPHLTPPLTPPTKKKKRTKRHRSFRRNYTRIKSRSATSRMGKGRARWLNWCFVKTAGGN